MKKKKTYRKFYAKWNILFHQNKKFKSITKDKNGSSPSNFYNGRCIIGFLFNTFKDWAGGGRKKNENSVSCSAIQLCLIYQIVWYHIFDTEKILLKYLLYRHNRSNSFSVFSLIPAPKKEKKKLKMKIKIK